MKTLINKYKKELEHLNTLQAKDENEGLYSSVRYLQGRIFQLEKVIYDLENIQFIKDHAEIIQVSIRDMLIIKYLKDNIDDLKSRGDEEDKNVILAYEDLITQFADETTLKYVEYENKIYKLKKECKIHHFVAVNIDRPNESIYDFCLPKGMCKPSTKDAYDTQNSTLKK